MPFHEIKEPRFADTFNTMQDRRQRSFTRRKRSTAIKEERQAALDRQVDFWA